VALAARGGVALAPAGVAGHHAIDPLSGRSLGTVVSADEAGYKGFSRRLAMIALVGADGAPTQAVATAIITRRLPVLAVVPRLDGAAVGLVVREHTMQRTVRALHEALLAPASVAVAETPASRSWPGERPAPCRGPRRHRVVGQKLVRLLDGHPGRVGGDDCSERSVGRPYGAAVHWLDEAPPPAATLQMVVAPSLPPLR